MLTSLHALVENIKEEMVNLLAINGAKGRDAMPAFEHQLCSDLPRQNVLQIWQTLVPLLWAVFIVPVTMAEQVHWTNSDESNTVAFRSATVCSACHSRIYNEWSKSWMARAYSNATFQANYAKVKASAAQGSTTTARSCLRCHAPFQYNDVSGERATKSEGVSCDYCHRVTQVRERSTQVHVPVLDSSGVIYGPSGGIDSSAHSTQRGSAFSDSSLCAVCHLDIDASGIPLERTYEEWKSSDFAKRGVGCAGCHMPQREGPATDLPGVAPRGSTHSSHRFHGGHANSPMLQSAARVEVVSADASRGLEIRVRNATVGHNFPTAGAHPNKLSLEIEIIGADGEVLQREVRGYSFTYLNTSGREATGDELVASVRDTTLAPLELRTENFSAALLIGGIRGTVQLVYRLIPKEIGLQGLNLSKSFFTENYRPVVIDTASFQVIHQQATIGTTDPQALNDASVHPSVVSVYTEIEEGMEAYDSGNYRKARELFQAEADKGDPEAKHLMASLYYQGHGVEKDIDKALALFKEAASADYIPSIVNLGVMYLKGDGVEQNYKISFNYYLEAADLGDLQSTFKVGQFYQKGYGVKQSNDDVKYWYKQAAERGYLPAQHEYGLLFAQGHGVPRDYVQAYAWINMPAEAGDDQAIKNKALLIKLMGPEAMQQATELAEKFKAKYPRQSNEQTGRR